MALNREQKKMLGDAAFGKAIQLVEFFGEDETTEALAAQGIKPSEAREQIEIWFSKIPSTYK
ncbi:hypothetical protein HWC80_gp041 [Mycobacterium phage Indlulamithi]|uniref:Uncharacterized protein n=1 Tax=Mycobacterium phage Indlulamithi TaxID=2656582 RepID=A0A649VCL4_9CAUD|nr:hypothetical protein HWC80_gp041 [Mycobacterium phage Indlulamithi]QGJ90081.1 hypothetical protein PBI_INDLULAMITHI_41 [Mycobacterium phage Indlulamithi]